MKAILACLFDHERLTAGEAGQLLLSISRGMCPGTQVAALLTVFQMRSITIDEPAGFREALMETRIHISFTFYRPTDTVGIGGDGKNMFNVSTCTCFIVARAGYKIAKYGNYGATSVSGASNIIEQHGIHFINNPDALKRSMEECSITYLHAQLFSPAMRLVAPVRRALGVRTLFNLLGPLVNPCEPVYQLLGVADLPQMRLYTNVFYKLGIDFAVVNSLDNYDKISLTDEFEVMTRNYERIYRPQALDLNAVRPGELSRDICKEDAAHIFDNILNNRTETIQIQYVIVNVAFAIQIIEPEEEIGERIAIVHESLESGRALKTLREFIEVNH